jgi:hypothetical protein
MQTGNKNSTTNVKVLLALFSLSGVLGLSILFTYEAQQVVNSYTEPLPVVSGQIFLPEMPTLVPIGNFNSQMASSQPEQVSPPQQELRVVSVPTPVVSETTPKINIQSVIINSLGGGGGNSSSSAPATTTKAS